MFIVHDADGNVVTGLVDGNFTRDLYDPDDTEVSGSVTVTITELGDGKYKATFTPNKAGSWILTVYHSTYFPGGKIANYLCVSEDITDAHSKLNRLLGLTHENIWVEHTWTGNNHTSSVVELYDSKANAQTHDGSTGLIAKYTVTVTYSGIKASNHLMVRDS